MSDRKEFSWFEIATELKTISQAGKTFAKDEYELKRHLRIEEITASILAKHTNVDYEQALAMLQDDCGYPTPKTDSRGAVFRDDKILLVKEIEDGGWTLPGGWCDVGMTPAENVVREIWEESGFETKAVKLIAILDRRTQGHLPPYPFDIYKMFFLCEITGGEAKTSIETSEVAFFSESQIPELSHSRTQLHQIEMCFEHYRNRDLPTVYD
ncbi:MAG: NUDIX hydrolase [Sedimentisphaeraceae bacterium JB056]